MLHLGAKGWAAVGIEQNTCIVIFREIWRCIRGLQSAYAVTVKVDSREGRKKRSTALQELVPQIKLFRSPMKILKPGDSLVRSL